MNDRFDYRALDPELHSRIRLAVVAVLASVEHADFRFLKEQTGATDGNLGAHMKSLREAGYVDEDKRFVDGRPNTRYCITEQGRRALSDYLARLQQMLGGLT